MSQTEEQTLLMEKRMKENSIAFKLFILVLNLTFFLAVPIAMAVTDTSFSEAQRSLPMQYTIFL